VQLGMTEDRTAHNRGNGGMLSTRSAGGLSRAARGFTPRLWALLSPPHDEHRPRQFLSEVTPDHHDADSSGARHVDPGHMHPDTVAVELAALTDGIERLCRQQAELSNAAAIWHSQVVELEARVRQLRQLAAVEDTDTDAVARAPLDLDDQFEPLQFDTDSTPQRARRLSHLWRRWRDT
jgi:hypothetical protein